jgi:hypothetical protein
VCELSSDGDLANTKSACAPPPNLAKKNGGGGWGGGASTVGPQFHSAAKPRTNNLQETATHKNFLYARERQHA